MAKDAVFRNFCLALSSTKCMLIPLIHQLQQENPICAEIIQKLHSQQPCDAKYS